METLVLCLYRPVYGLERSELLLIWGNLFFFLFLHPVTGTPPPPRSASFQLILRHEANKTFKSSSNICPEAAAKEAIPLQAGG
jgi:hypothetical protein